MEQLNSRDKLPSFRVDGHGEPLVLIMGLGGRKEAWVPQTWAFKRHYRVIAFDNRGVDKTRVQEEPITIELMVADVLALLDHLGIDKAHVLGYSLGGLVAQELAIRYPERVKKLILASTFAAGVEYDPSAHGLAKALGLQPGQKQLTIEGPDVKRAMSAVLELSFNRWAYRMAARILARVFPQQFEDSGVAGQFQAGANANTLDRLGSIQAPTLVLTGAADRLIDPAASRLLASRIPHARLVMIEGGSHAFAIELTQQFNRAVLDFLGDC